MSDVFKELNALPPESRERVVKRLAETLAKQGMERWKRMRGEEIEADNQLAYYWYRKAAVAGDATGMFNLCCMYESGEGGVEQDDEKALYWQYSAARNGHVTAQYDLGQRYTEGVGVTQDHKVAAEWFCKAAAQGHDKAQQYLESRGIDWRKQDAS